MQYPEPLDNYNIDVFNNNFMQLFNKSQELDTGLADEISRAKAAEKSNADNIVSESDRAAARENKIEGDIVDAVNSLTAAINAAKNASNTYTNQKIADLIGGAPAALDTLKEIADALQDSNEAMETLNSAIGNKASKTDLTTHTGNTQIHVTQSDKTKWNGAANPTFETATQRVNIASGEDVGTLFSKIKKWFTDLKTIAFTGSYNDLSDKPTIPAVGNGTVTIKQGGVSKGSFTLNQSSNKTINLELGNADQIVLSSTLAKGATAMSFTDSKITSTALIDIYTDTYGLAPTTATISGNTLNLTFSAQSKAVAVKVKVVAN